VIGFFVSKLCQKLAFVNRWEAKNPTISQRDIVERVWVRPTVGKSDEQSECWQSWIQVQHSFLSLTMTSAQILLTLLIIWGIPSTYFRSKFRKIVYQTEDWKINIQPLFKKEIVGLFSNMYPENQDYLKTRNQYRIYLAVYLIIFILYQYFKK
jgi:peroxiredoxin Q/BCP